MVASRLHLLCLWLYLLLPLLRPKLQGSLIPEHAQTHNHPDGLVAEIAVVAPRLARVHVGDVQFHEGEAGREQGVPEGDGRVGKSCGVDDDGDIRCRFGCRFDSLGLGGCRIVCLSLGRDEMRMQEINNRALMVRLERHDGDAELLAALHGLVDDLFERRRAVDLRFAGPQEVEVGAVDQEHLARAGTGG